jgi:hypothetical protein
MTAAQASPALGRWFALGAATLFVATLLPIAELAADAQRTLRAPSPGVVWGLALSAFLTGMAGATLGRAGQRSIGRGVAMGALLGGVVIAGYAGYAALGPPVAALPGCRATPAAAAGVLDARGSVDGRPLGNLVEVPIDGASLAAAIAGLGGVPLEDHGIERLAGTDARRCSALVDGSTALAALPPLAALSGDTDRPLHTLPVWRGELEWWLAADGKLVAARVRIGGHPADAWGGRGLRGQIWADFRLARRG